jgi:hypothetical protein
LSGRTVPLAELVSGERLQALAEVTLLPRMIARRGRGPDASQQRVIEFESHRDLSDGQLARLSATRSMFVYTDALELFKEHVWPRLTGGGYVLITHGSDTEIDARQLPWIDGAGDKLGHWFAQNLLAEHPKLTPLPIGLANRKWPHGDLDAVARTVAPTQRDGILYAAFALDSHPDRERAWAAVSRAFPGSAPPDATQPFEQYLGNLACHRFSACPRGNGIDTHRFWECQYLGVVPVVERSTHTEMWAKRGLPMVLLDDWSELTADRLRPVPPPAELGREWLELSHYARIVQAAASDASRAVVR